MGENMNYPDNPIDFIKQYSFSDKQQVYTNGSELISVFRVGQMIEHYMSDLTPQQIKDMQFCLREKSRECAELRRELQELKDKKNDGWIPVEDRLPEDGKTVLCTDGEYVYLTEYDADLDAPFGDIDGIAHWQPSPEPHHPERSEDNE